jgi:hypothetical protein
MAEKISYSSAIDLKNCGWYFKLRNFDRIPVPENFSALFGTQIHDSIQSLLKNGDLAKHLSEFETSWKEVCEKNKDLIKPGDDPEGLRLAGINIMSAAEKAFKDNLPFKEVLSVEFEINTQAISANAAAYKGYIDMVLKREDDSIVILDFKTCKSAFFFTKYQDKYKEYQLTLYKHYYAELAKVDPDKIETYFVLLEKNPTSKKPVQFVKVTSGSKKTENAIGFISDSLKVIDRGLFLKNRSHCTAYGKFCPYFKTEYCK